MMSGLKKINLLLTAVMLFSICVFAQDQDNTLQGQEKNGKKDLIESSAQELTDNLATKITLTDDQKQSIKDAIYKYQASVIGIAPGSGLDAQKDVTGTESGTTGIESDKDLGTTETDKGTLGKEEGTKETDTGTESTEEGTSGTSSTGTEQLPGNMPQGDMDQWLNSEIETVLQESQKAQWEVAKADFWNQMRDRISTLQQSSDGKY